MRAGGLTGGKKTIPDLTNQTGRPSPFEKETTKNDTIPAPIARNPALATQIIFGGLAGEIVEVRRSFFAPSSNPTHPTELNAMARSE